MVFDEWTDARTDNPKPICPINFFEGGGIKITLLPYFYGFMAL